MTTDENDKWIHVEDKPIYFYTLHYRKWKWKHYYLEVIEAKKKNELFTEEYWDKLDSAIDSLC